MGITFYFLPKREIVKIAGEDGYSLLKSFIICVAIEDGKYLILMVSLIVQKL